MTKSRERAQESRKRACTVTANGEENKLWKDDSLMIEKELMGLWLNTLASKSPIPGGGGASAIGGALAAALGQMVANLTVGKKKYAAVEETMQEVLGKLQTCQADFLDLVDQDAKVFAPLAAAYALPTSTEEEKQEKARIMEERLLAASLVPLHMMEKAAEMLEFLEILAEKGSRMAVSDVGVAVQFARTALTGAIMNVYINTKSMKNREKAEELNTKANDLMKQGIRRADEIYTRVLEQLA